MLPLTKPELAFILSSLRECEVHYGDTGRWDLANKLNKLYSKLVSDLNRYEEV